jgi:hypothetical protein
VSTEDVIRRLAETNAPVRRLRPPWTRALTWLALALPYAALVIWLHPHTPAVSSSLSDWHLIVEILAALATGLTAAWAAFASTVPTAASSGCPYCLPRYGRQRSVPAVSATGCSKVRTDSHYDPTGIACHPASCLAACR